MSKLIAYVGPFAYPSGGANSQRVAGVVSAIKAAGWDVMIGSGQRDNQVDSALIQELHEQNVTNLAEFPDYKWSKFKRVLRGLTWGGRTVHWLKNLQKKPDVVIVYGAHLGYLLRLLLWCRETKTPLLVDMVEWYQPSHLPGGMFGPFSIAFEVATRFVVAKAGNVLAISSFLKCYYDSKGCRTFYIPPIFDVQSYSPKNLLSTSEFLKLAYVGNPGKKDLLDNAIEAVLRIDTTGNIIKFLIAGPKVEEIINMPAIRSRNLLSLPGSIVALGSLAHDQALDTVRSADFIVLLRPNQRYAKAGFPSKVPESFSLGTPVICNLTSDLKDYVRDGEEGLVCKDYTVDACVAAFERALSLSVETRNKMSIATRACAENCFDFRLYVQPIRIFLDSLIGAKS